MLQTKENKKEAVQGRVLSQQEFEKAKVLAGQIRELVLLRDEFVKQGKLDPEFVLPSDLWDATLKLFSYCFDPSFEIVNTWRLHTYPFKGSYPMYVHSNEHNPPPANLLARYLHHTNGLPDELIVRPPNMCAELGWQVNGGIASWDTLIDQFYIGQLYFSGALDYLKKRKSISILEIGGGYGGFAAILKKVLTPQNYVMVDLPETLLFPTVYLGVTQGESVDHDSIYNGKKELALRPGKFSFVPNFLIKEVEKNTNMKFDLVINISSFGEMTSPQVRRYAEFVHNVLKDDGLFYESNGQDMSGSVPPIIAEKFKYHTSLIDNQKLWHKQERITEELRKSRPDRSEFLGKFKLSEKVVKTLGSKKAASRSMVREWIKILLDRF